MASINTGCYAQMIMKIDPKKQKMKIVIVCTFSNSLIREHLRLDKRNLYSFVRRLIKLPAKSKIYVDLASWNSNLIENLSYHEEIDLNVIATHSGLKDSKTHFKINNVKYWFLNSDISTLLKHVIKNPKVWLKLNPLRSKVKKIINEIKPDLIALMGAENAFISSTILGLENKYPIIVKLQTVYNNPERIKNGYFDKINGYVEKKIFNNLKYFSAMGELHCGLFRKFQPSAPNLIWYYSNNYPPVNEVDKEFDFVNFAMGMTSKKGFPDSLKALKIVKEFYPTVKLNLVGGGTNKQVNEIKELIKELNIENNVTITPLFPKQEDVFQHIKKSRFALLPCKMDDIASTIKQSMYYSLPVICYKTRGGTELLNLDNENVLLAENSNYQDLAEKMKIFLADPMYAAKISKSAKEYYDKNYDNDKITRQVIENFKAVINNFYFDVPIPSDLLYESNM